MKMVILTDTKRRDKIKNMDTSEKYNKINISERILITL